jgi:hypothetical protein
MKNYLIFLGGIALASTFFVLAAYTHPDSTAADSANNSDEFRPNKIYDKPFQAIYAPPVPAKIDFAGEELPQNQFDAYERFDRELMQICFSHSSTMSTMKLAARYFPTIEPILAKYNVPDDIKYIALAESNLRNATSPAGAKGIWQFMPETARSFGLEVGDEIDERYNLPKVTEAACKLLTQSYKSFNSWTLAAASYNMGPAGLRKNMDSQKHTSYYDLNLNQETSRYIPRILVFKYVMQDPQTYGFMLDKADLYPALPKYKDVEVRTPIPNWSDFAKEQGISYRTLKLHNPWIMSEKLTNKSGKVYLVQIPINEK